MLSLVPTRFEQVPAAVSEDHGAVVRAEWRRLQQTLSFEVALGLACFLAAIVELALCDDTKGADGREHPAFRAVDLVHAIAFSDRPALASAWQVEVLREHVAWIATAGLIAVGATATAATASVAEVVAVAIVGRARIVSVPHDRRLSRSTTRSS
jgi:hypothetical protein